MQCPSCFTAVAILQSQHIAGRILPGHNYTVSQKKQCSLRQCRFLRPYYFYYIFGSVNVVFWPIWPNIIYILYICIPICERFIATDSCILVQINKVRNKETQTTKTSTSPAAAATSLPHSRRRWNVTGELSYIPCLRLLRIMRTPRYIRPMNGSIS